MLAPDGQNLLISIIVCTRNRADRLKVCLEHLAKLDFPRESVEVVVVDNGSTDPTEEVIRGFADSAPFSVLSVYQAVPGLTRSRNIGARHAKAEILVFVDDDCYVAPDYLRQTMAVYKEHDITFFGGKILLYDSKDYPITFRDSDMVQRIEPFCFVGPGLIQGANMSARRAALEQIGGFDRHLGPGGRFCCEDMDFAARLADAGFAGGYFPAPLVYHHHGRRAGPAVEQLKRSYAHGSGAHFAKSWLRHRGHPRYLLHFMKHMARQLLKKRLMNIFWNIMGFGDYLLYRLRLGRRY